MALTHLERLRSPEFRAELTEKVKSGYFRSCVDVARHYPTLFPYQDAPRAARRILEEFGLTLDGKSHPPLENIRHECNETPNPEVVEVPATAPIAGGMFRNKRHDEERGTIDATAKTDRQITSLEDLYDFFEVDLDTWTVKTWDANAWGGFYVNKTKNEHVKVPLYQVKAHFVRRDKEIALTAFFDKMIARAEAHAPTNYLRDLSPRTASTPHIAVIRPVDAHFGKFAWGQQCWRNEKYDTEIARKLYTDANSVLLSKIARHAPERIVITIGDDLFNADNSLGTTTRGTPQDMDGRFQRTFEIVEETVVAAIDNALLIAPVDIIILPGNHDSDTAFQFGRVLRAWYRNVDDVRVDTRPLLKKYYQYGANMLCFTHGDKEKTQKLATSMPTDDPVMWAATAYHEVHIGHVHRERMETDDYSGTKVRTSMSISAADRWHTEAGFTAVVRGVQAYIYHKDDGISATEYYNVPGRYETLTTDVLDPWK